MAGLLWDLMVACPQHNLELGLCTSSTSDTGSQTLLLRHKARTHAESGVLPMPLTAPGWRINQNSLRLTTEPLDTKTTAQQTPL